MFLGDSRPDDESGVTSGRIPSLDDEVQFHNPLLHVKLETELGIGVSDFILALVYHDEHGGDERHVEYDLDAVLACGEEEGEREILFEETVKIMESFT